MYDDFEYENIIKTKLEKMLHIGSEDTYFISKEVYDAEVGDGNFAYWEEMINEFDRITRSKDCYYNQKTISVEMISENSLEYSVTSNNYRYSNDDSNKIDIRKLLSDAYKTENITYKQQKRFEAFFLNGISVIEIAELDGIRRQSVYKSIKKVWKKIATHSQKNN